MHCWPALVKNWCLYSCFWNNSRQFFPLGEAWLCHSRSLQTSAASIRALLTPPPPLAAAVSHGKDVSILGFLPPSMAIVSLLLLLLLLRCLPICLPFCVLVSWYCWCDVYVMNFLLCLWVFLSDLAVFFCVLYQVVNLGCPPSRMLALARPSVSVSLC